MRDASGELTARINVLVDITERKCFEEALRQSIKRFHFVAESMPQKIFTAKPNGDVDYFNQQWMEFTGLPFGSSPAPCQAFEQIKGWGWTQFIHPDDLDENIRLWQHSLDTGEPFKFVHRFRRADGVYRWHLSRAHAMRGADRKISMWIGSNTEFELTVIEDGGEPLAFAKREGKYARTPLPDLAVLDLNLPKNAGTEVLAAIGQSSDLFKLPVAIMTSAAAPQQEEESKQLGVACYITKPLYLEEFLSIGEVLRQLLMESRSRAEGRRNNQAGGSAFVTRH